MTYEAQVRFRIRVRENAGPQTQAGQMIRAVDQAESRGRQAAPNPGDRWQA